MRRLTYALGFVAALGLLVLGCDKQSNPVGTELNGSPSAAALTKSTANVPSPLVNVTVGANTLEFWPYTGVDYSGTPQDPMNLIFVEQGDPRALRDILMSLDGDRTAFGLPNVPPFNFTWADGIGGVQTTYAEPEGWTGSAIQLTAGPYGPIRFHLRLLDAGDYVLGGAHFEVLIPGTTDHQVLSWELAEQLIVVDFIRSGLLAAPPQQTGFINEAPYKEIPAIIYNGLPVELRAAIGGPLGDVSSPVPIGTDGRATILSLAGSVLGESGVTPEEFTINFAQVIPKPFCASGPYDFLLVQGPVQLRQQVNSTPSGNLISQLHAIGHLDLTPWNPLTNEPSGETYRAVVNEHHKGIITDRVTQASSFQMFIEIPSAGPFRGRLSVKLSVGPGQSNHYKLEANCE